MLCLGLTSQVHPQRDQPQKEEPKAPAGCNTTDGTAALQKPWDFLSRATRILRSWTGELEKGLLSQAEVN